jgi:hypothetical protein
VIYFLQPHYTGMDSFTYRVSDGRAFSNVATVSINVVPRFTTFTQGQWGASPNGSAAGALLSANFAELYPSGVSIGSNGRIVTFTTAAAIRAFLPSGGKAGSLPAGPNYPLVNPSSTKAGVFAGNVLALQMNVDFSLAGKTRNGLGDLRLASGKLQGYTVAAVLALAKQVLGTGAGLPSGVDLGDLNGIVASINSNFDRGREDDGSLIP